MVGVIPSDIGWVIRPSNTNHASRTLGQYVLGDIVPSRISGSANRSYRHLRRRGRDIGPLALDRLRFKHSPGTSAPGRTHLRAGRFAVLVVAALLSAWTGWSAPAATIDGAEALSLADLYAAAASAIDGHEAALRRCQIDAERDRHAAIETTLRELVRARLLALEADRLGITAEALEARISDSAEPVTDAEVSAFHRQRGITQPLAEIAPRIRAYLEHEATELARASAYGEMEQRYSVAYLLQPLRYDVAADGFPSSGPPDAPVTIVEFSDFECPYCARLLPTLQRVKHQYAGKLRVVYRHYPLTGIHPNAWKAAEAALCAGEQGRFWDLHDLMFAEQGALTVADVKEKATRLQLDAETFNRCLDSSRHHGAVLADVRAGDAVGVSGTPAMFVNGRFIGGAASFRTLAAIIDDELRRADT